MATRVTQPTWMVSLQLSALHLKVMTAQLPLTLLASEAPLELAQISLLTTHSSHQYLSPLLILLQSSYHRSFIIQPGLTSLIASSPVSSLLTFYPQDKEAGSQPKD